MSLGCLGGGRTRGCLETRVTSFATATVSAALRHASFSCRSASRKLARHESNVAPRRLANRHTALPAFWEDFHHPHIISTLIPLGLKLPRSEAWCFPSGWPCCPSRWEEGQHRHPRTRTKTTQLPTPRTEHQTQRILLFAAAIGKTLSGCSS